MRVIAGSARGMRLQSVPGDTTRPITDRAKEALFSILNTWVMDARFLDLFGGTGAVGIEALSRGAAHAHFIDRSRKATEVIQANLAHTRLADRATVQVGDSLTFLQRHPQDPDPYDLVFIAPPQYKEMWSQALLLVDARPDLLAVDATVIVQIHPKESHPVELVNLVEYDRREYGSVLLIFYGVAEDLAGTVETEEA